MKRAEKKRRARKFNVCKKICQLNRVATLFSIQYNEQTFQRQYLADLYSSKIASVLDNAWNESENCYNKVNSVYPEVKSKYQQIFIKKYNQIKIDYNVFFQSTGEMIQRKLRDISKQIDYKKNEISIINDKFEKYHNPNYESELFDGFVDNLNSLVKIQKQRYNSQKTKIYETLKSNVCLLKNESDMRIQKMNSDKEIEKKHIKSAYPQSHENLEILRQFLENFLISFQKRFQHYQSTLKSIEDKFEASQDTTRDSISNTKIQIFKEIDKIRRLHRKFHKEKKEAILKIDSYNNDDELKSLKQELATKIADFQNEEKKLKDQLFETRQKFENMLQFRELNQKGRLSNFENIFIEVQKNQENEISNIKLKFNQIVKSANDQLNQIESEISEISETTESQNLIEQTLQNQIKENLAQNANSIEKIEREFENDRNNLIREFQQKKNEIQSQNSNLYSTLNELENQKKFTLLSFKSFCDTIEIDEQKEIENLSINFNLVISELRTEFSNELNKLSQKSNEEIEKVEIENKKKMNEKIKQYEFLHNQEIVKAQFNFECSQIHSNKNHLKEVSDYYSNIFEDYKNKLSSISPPSFNDNYARLTVELSGLNQKLNESIEIIENEKKKLNESFNSKIEKENERHKSVVSKQEEVLKILSQIQKVRNEKEKLIEKFNGLQNCSFSDDDDDQIEFEKKLDLIEHHYLNQRNLIMKQIEAIQSQIFEKKEFLINSISELKKSFEIQIKPFQQKYNAIMKKQRSLLSHSPNSNIPFDELVLKKMRTHKEKVKKLKDSIQDVKTARQLVENEFEHQLFISKQKFKKNFEMNENKMKEEFLQLSKKRDELKSSLKNLNACGIEKLNSFSSSRNYSKEKIAKLTVRLNKVNQHLSTVLIEYKKCKEILESQEGIMSTSFGANQAVPALQLTSNYHVSPAKYNV